MANLHFNILNLRYTTVLSLLSLSTGRDWLLRHQQFHQLVVNLQQPQLRRAPADAESDDLQYDDTSFEQLESQSDEEVSPVLLHKAVDLNNVRSNSSHPFKSNIRENTTMLNHSNPEIKVMLALSLFAGLVSMIIIAAMFFVCIRNEHFP